MRHYKLFSIALACVALALTGCHDNHYHDDYGRNSYTTQIMSDPAFDGDIEQTSSTTYTVTQGMSSSVQSVFAGIDPVASTEFRAFLDFPLTGASGVPGDAIIESAYLNIYINSLQPVTGTLPIRIELVEFQPPTLIGSDFDRTTQPALAYIIANPPFDRNDVGTNSSIDVTPLMIKAQQLNLQDFQVRIMEDLGPAIPVLMEINDTTGSNRSNRAPLLIVTYH
ncbi:MAG TPA: hypothetical protein VG962_02280 [Steroidobacteraceae bacterium]|nr:hypothetical protein [Steroidobacteraceae bacterium]